MNRLRTLTLATLLSATLAGAADAQCCGDCQGDGNVTINDLITAVNNALSNCGAPTPTPQSTATPSRRPTATRTPANVCRSTFVNNSGGACVFRGNFNRGCGNALNSTFQSNGTVVIVTIDTMLSNPRTVQFSAVVDTANNADLTGWSTDGFRTTNPVAGQLELENDGRQMVISPNDPPFQIQSCNFVQYIGTYVGRAASIAAAEDPALFERAGTTVDPPELEQP